MAKVGGTGAVQAADAKIQELADKVLTAHDTLNAVPTSLSHTLTSLPPSLTSSLSLNPPLHPCPQVRPTLEKESSQVFQEYKAETYCSQVVAGINYFIKVYIPYHVMKLPTHVSVVL